MGASQFVGRVGGLAVALGIGAAVFSGGVGVAFADSGSQSDTGTPSAANGHSGRASNAGSAREARHARKAAAPAAAVRSAQAESADSAIDAVPEVAIDPVVDALPDPAVDVDPVAVELGNDDAAPEVIAYSAPPAPKANATASSRLTATPKTIYYDGILQGNLNVTSSSGCGTIGSTCKLAYSFVDSSAGGKASLGNVPVSLPGLPSDAAGGAGSFTFLPYATWIDPNAPTKFPVATGTQNFTVRVSENTKFDQVITNIPVVGLIAEPVIKFMQDLPLISSLLAPLIGASLLTTVETNVGALAAGKQVAYTYTVSSFDGTPISMNYFPASAPSLVLPGQQQATIFNGPGLGSPGATDPYALLNTGGAAPPLGAMRGQGLPAPFTTAPVGFNVITWDPRGIAASGGSLQLDSPFFEGRDVSSLITWANANTPLLNEKSVFADPNDPDAPLTPDVAMMGGSYGGGIQMTTVDPRIKAIVPSIAWNSLNQSLYPDSVFKAGWANILALFLLRAGATINPVINEGIIRGNLLGSLSESQQAALASSGPTVLLSKLSAPTMYTQGTVDALFPLQQALNNAQTQLEQNPYFGQTSDDWGDYSAQVKMIWFCGGHGVCSTQTLAQQTAQNTDMFLENILWANTFTKAYLANIPAPPIPGVPLPPGASVQDLLKLVYAFTPTFQWWDQNGTALASTAMPWTSDFQDAAPLTFTNATGGDINWRTSRSGPLSTGDPAAEFLLTPDQTVCDFAPACSFPLNNAFATEAKNAVNVPIVVPDTTDPKKPSVIVGAPLVSFTYSGRGNAKAVYAQVVDNATGQVLGNINTPIPVILDGKEHTVDAFPIANIAYTAPGIGGNSNLTLQIVARSSDFKAARMSVSLTDVSVSLPRTTTAEPNALLALLP